MNLQKQSINNKFPGHLNGFESPMRLVFKVILTVSELQDCENSQNLPKLDVRRADLKTHFLIGTLCFPIF